MKLKIISDGTKTGTKLIDEDTGEMIPGVSKLTWEANAAEFITKVSVEFFNIPVEIIAKAEVELYDWDKVTKGMAHTKTFEKNIRVECEQKKNQIAIPPHNTFIYDNDTNERVGAITEIKWEATAEGTKAKVKRIKFDKNDW